MGAYQTLLLPRLTDFAMRGDEIDALRARVVGQARGRVLEVGFGTGLNARHYGKDVDLTVIDDNAGMVALATKRLQKAKLTAQHQTLSGESLPFADDSFDTVVVTFTLCSIADVSRALQEMKRVLKPDGRLLFLEHGLAEEPRMQRWQHRLTPVWRPFAGGCHLDRDPAALLRAAGFHVDVDGTAQLSSGPLLGSVRFGHATKAPAQGAPEP